MKKARKIFEVIINIVAFSYISYIVYKLVELLETKIDYYKQTIKTMKKQGEIQDKFFKD